MASSVEQPDLFKPKVKDCDDAILTLLKADRETLRTALDKHSCWSYDTIRREIDDLYPKGWGA